MLTLCVTQAQRICVFTPDELRIYAYTRHTEGGGGKEGRGEGERTAANMCSITHAIDGPFDESLVANKKR